jgi:hypothetical protein
MKPKTVTNLLYLLFFTALKAFSQANDQPDPASPYEVRAMILSE